MLSPPTPFTRSLGLSSAGWWKANVLAQSPGLNTKHRWCSNVNQCASEANLLSWMFEKPVAVVKKFIISKLVCFSSAYMTTYTYWANTGFDANKLSNDLAHYIVWINIHLNIFGQQLIKRQRKLTALAHYQRVHSSFKLSFCPTWWMKLTVWFQIDSSQRFPF